MQFSHTHDLLAMQHNSSYCGDIVDVWGPVGQGDWLRQMGIGERLKVRACLFALVAYD